MPHPRRDRVRRPAARRLGRGAGVTAHELTSWVLPLVVRIERDAPPTRTDALEAAARRGAAHADHRRAGVGRRGRAPGTAAASARSCAGPAGAEWRRAAGAAGLDGRARGSAEVRVYPPIPVDGWPPELARLQVGGTELDDPSRRRAPTRGVPLILLSPDVEMSAGQGDGPGRARRAARLAVAAPAQRAALAATPGSRSRCATRQPRQWRGGARGRRAGRPRRRLHRGRAGRRPPRSSLSGQLPSWSLYLTTEAATDHSRGGRRGSAPRTGRTARRCG